MNKLISAGISIALVAMTAAITTNASAQEKTREQVRQELIQAENNGLRFVTDTSYPEVAPIYEAQVARMKTKSGSDAGAEPAGAQQADHAATSTANPEACVGPVSFCKLYFGS